MLIKYKKDYEKIVMGFLSYLDDFKNIKNIQEEMELYHKKNEYQIFLFKHKDGDVEGIIGIQMAPQFVMVRYISLSPAYRTTENQLAILQELKRIFPVEKILSTPENAELMELFERTQDEWITT